MKKYIFKVILLSVGALNSMAQVSNIRSIPINQTKDAGFNTSQYEAYEYTRVLPGPTIQKLPFRLLKPTQYSLPANVNTKYPLVIMLHGRGEAGSDNNYQLKWGGKEHLDAVNNVFKAGYTGPRTFDGFVLYPQEPYGQWTNSPYFANSPQLTSALSQVHDVIDSLIKNYRVDPTR
ncbi:MAG: hypothetical protein H7329_03020, partial [Opitutaceae bacterium]|nr:hypothetical protein [Cytophagales bacterium]